MKITCCLTLVLCFVDLCSSLLCWHCIADDCDANPEDNHKAEQRHCLDGHICQKVVFEMQSDIDDTKYKSTVRSCSEECHPQNDYLNCTTDLYTTRGCVKRACCSDNDLCNGAAATLYHYHSQTYYHCLLFALLQYFISFRVFSCITS